METILKKAETFVLNYLNENLKSTFIYHNYNHTQFVVSKVTEIIQAEIYLGTNKKLYCSRLGSMILGTQLIKPSTKSIASRSLPIF